MTTKDQRELLQELTAGAAAMAGTRWGNCMADAAETLICHSTGKVTKDQEVQSMRDTGNESAADEIERLTAYIEQIEKWRREGEEVFNRGGALFALGQWWADRPWRKRPMT